MDAVVAVQTYKEVCDAICKSAFLFRTSANRKRLNIMAVIVMFFSSSMEPLNSFFPHDVIASIDTARTATTIIEMILFTVNYLRFDITYLIFY